MNKINLKYYLLGLLFLLLLFVTIFNFSYIEKLFTNLDFFKEYILSFGIYAPLITILLTCFQVLFAPVPGQVAGFASGFIFGIGLGTFYSMVGITLGSAIAFILAKKFGRSFVQKVTGKKLLQKLDSFKKEKIELTFLFIFLLPALPDDLFNYLAGLTSLSLKRFLIISILGRLPGFFILNVLGSGFNLENNIFLIVLFVGIVLISSVLYYFRENLEKKIFSIISKIENKKSEKVL